jgi:hypothetical protein
MWWLNWCSVAGCTALGRFFRVGRSCSVLDFNGFPQVVQCAGQAFYVEFLAFQKTEISGYVCKHWECALHGHVWMFSFILLDGTGFVGVVALVVAGCVCGGCSNA